jgi:hypothetical protein
MVGALVNLIVYLLVIGILVTLVYWVVDAIPIPEPINRIIKIVLVVLVALVVILLLLQLIGAGGDLRLPRVTG